jgi:5'-methylthioadenosine phosphorylase
MSLALTVGGGARGLELPAGDWRALQRHGERYALPHEIDHVANMRQLVDTGSDRVLAIGSVGGLRRELVPGTFVCPDDFIALDAPAASALAGIAAHRVPGFDPDWRGQVLAAFAEADGEARIDLRDGGVYWQASGPRLETPAEIRFVAQHADVIGMTVASECVAAGEVGLRYAAVCVVDNFANGVADTELTLAEVESGRARNREALAGALAAVLPGLA